MTTRRRSRSDGARAAPKAPEGDGDRNDERAAERAVDRTSPEALQAAALRYLNRYDASVEQLRRVLLRQAQRHAAPAQLPEVRRHVDALLARFQESRLLDDGRYADTLARGLRERGASTIRIRQKLRQRGVAETIVEEVLQRAASEPGDADLNAARAYARRRRLTTRYDLTNPAERQKALAALARQGFSYGTAVAALGASSDDGWEEP
ncbi:MAG: RecX family transcriptional regulator [Myxococcales bacterium]|jgi:regulatory protein|nr:RecX family transcriptional regulator [Myxococcales bacterium]